MTPLLTIAGIQVWQTIERKLQWTAGAMIDSDGAPGNPHHDPDWQADTSLTWQGKPVNALDVPYIVVPPAIIRAVRGIVLGCQGWVENIRTGALTPAVVADVGPRTKLGELSVRAAELLGIPSHARKGGTKEKIIRYTIAPGVAAVVNGHAYTLKASR